MSAGSRAYTLGLLTCLGVIVAPCPAEAQIAELVGQVSQATIQIHIAALEGERNTPAQQAAAASYIRAQLESYGYTVDSDPVVTPLFTSENLIATLPGTVTPSQVTIVGAHFDAAFGSPGADDNASGVAGMLEVARVLAGTQTGSTVQFVAFALEEVGLRGSSQFAQNAKAAGTNVVGMLALEMIGYTCTTPGCQAPFSNIPGCAAVSTAGITVGTFLGIVGNDSSASLISDFKTTASTYVPGLGVEWLQVAGTGACFPDSRRSDHAPFWVQGYPAIMVTDTANFRNPNYHAPSDTLSTLDLSFATDVTRATLAMVATRAGVLSPPVCGNGLVEGIEQCDAGNTVGGDCCSAGCRFEAAGSVCDDNLFCTTGNTCNGAGACGTPDTCSDGVGCTVDTCDEVADQCTSTPNNAVCDDSLFCNGTETCDAVNDCQAGTPVDCSDGVGCTVDVCNEGTNACDNTPDDAACDDGLFCNGTETCDAVNDCRAGTLVDCHDTDICTDDACNETTDRCDNILDPGNDPSCVLPVCGNGVLEETEECDDGNIAGGDCCSATCQLDPAGNPCTDDGNACTNDVCDEAGACAHLASRTLCIMEGKMCGQPSLIAGCRAQPILAAVVVDPEGDAMSVQGAVTLNGATAGKLSLRSVAAAPAACGSFPQGQVFAGALKLKAQGGGTLQIKLVATDRARNVSPPYVLPAYDIVPNKAPTVGEVTLSRSSIPVGEKGELRVTAEVDDDCGVGGALVEIDFGNGRGFQRVGSLSDNGTRGDTMAGDGIWTGVAKVQCREPGNLTLHVAVEDTHGEMTHSDEFSLTCQ